MEQKIITLSLKEGELFLNTIHYRMKINDTTGAAISFSKS